MKYDPSNQHSHHDREDDGGHSGLEDPEDGQTCDLHQSEEVHAPQRDVTQEHEIWLVLGWHEEQLHPLPELNETGKLWWNLPPHGHRVPKLKLSLITSTWLHLIISKIFMILHHSCCCYTLYNLFAHSCLYYYLLALQYTVLHILYSYFFTTPIFMYILLCLCNYNCTVHGADSTYISLFCLYSV